jgi:SpoVK/Ycf46/Vps4 family AAA+-type ATPase
MQARLTMRPEVLDRRRETVEHPFGTIKQWMNQGTFLMRDLEKVRAEFDRARRRPRSGKNIIGSSLFEVGRLAGNHRTRLRPPGPPGMILAGRTGSGKTAILRHIERSAEHIAIIEPSEMALGYISNSDE